jgi:hypothetical protein
MDKGVSSDLLRNFPMRDHSLPFVVGEIWMVDHIREKLMAVSRQKWHTCVMAILISPLLSYIEAMRKIFHKRSESTGNIDMGGHSISSEVIG